LCGLPSAIRCNYCDTEYAFYEGNKQTLKEIMDAVAFRCPLVEVTGGKPLLQKNVLPLMSVLCDSGYTVSMREITKRAAPTYRLQGLIVRRHRFKVGP
jgi:Organic radical activating enzymes